MSDAKPEKTAAPKKLETKPLAVQRLLRAKLGWPHQRAAAFVEKAAADLLDKLHAATTDQALLQILDAAVDAATAAAANKPAGK